MIDSTIDDFSTLKIKEYFLHLQVLLFFQTKEKENHTTTQMTLDTDRPWGVTYMFICCLGIKIISVVTTYIFKDSLLETKMSCFHTSFCGCLTFIFFSNLTFMEALKFYQNVSALPISEWKGPMGWW
jgi:hypothetical protein